ncbi:MAG: hypothetical protein ACE5GE_16530 [Phycisphaerae bacterium]
MAAPYVFTFTDVLDSLDYFARAMQLGADLTLRRQVVRAAYREVIQARDWTFLRANARIKLQAPQTTGTVSYDHTGGTFERQLTLSSATFPSDWTVDASIRLGSPDIVVDVEDRKSSTVVTLDATMAPIADISSTTYSLYPRWYRLPTDFASAAEPLDEDAWIVGTQVSKARIEQLNRYEDRTGSLECYAFGAPLDLFGAMALYIHPPTDETETLDIPYNRRPRDIVYTGYDTSLDNVGTISVTAASATVTGSGTAFESGMVNSILRIGKDTTYSPGGLESQYPYGEQRVIKSVASATSLTLDANVATTRTGVKYRIADPIDLDVILFDAFQRCCEKHLARMLRGKNYNQAEREFERAIRAAKEADCRGGQPVVAGGNRYTSRLTDSSQRPMAGFS